MFNSLDGLYLCKRYLLINTISKDQWRKQSAAENEKLNKEKNPRKKLHLRLLQKNYVLCIKTKKIDQQVT